MKNQLTEKEKVSVQIWAHCQNRVWIVRTDKWNNRQKKEEKKMWPYPPIQIVWTRLWLFYQCFNNVSCFESRNWGVIFGVPKLRRTMSSTLNYYPLPIQLKVHKVWILLIPSLHDAVGVHCSKDDHQGQWAGVEKHSFLVRGFFLTQYLYCPMIITNDVLNINEYPG